MKKIFILSITLVFLAGSCNTTEKSDTMKNPLLQEFNTPFGVPPFNEIVISDYAPAIREALKVHNDEIEKILSSKKKP